MGTFQTLMEYLATGVILVALTDLLAFMTGVSNTITNPQRVFLVLLWPVTAVLFIYSIFKTLVGRF